MGCSSSKPAHREHLLAARPIATSPTSSSPSSRTTFIIAQEAQQQQQSRPPPAPHPATIPPLSGSSPFLTLPCELRQKILFLTIDLRAEINSTATRRTIHTFVPTPGLLGCGGRMLCRDVVKGVFNPAPTRAWANTLRRVCALLEVEMRFVEADWMRRGREEEFEVYSRVY
ncbi:hypothetical protein E2P81_ATG10821 [Venturia nashicola]|uniref:Uncharacterized protein n=1 Tax=Venturia nashicola TaxID=86259 RepID=A0A4Z1P1B2_9PEZI|nr:hypothetical protein E6O75_ATG10494 [Venturia nashicola]TLD27533.1 hypothetical protein E2P81_ATG10821 [Venturia nashicola]